MTSGPHRSSGADCANARDGRIIRRSSAAPPVRRRIVRRPKGNLLSGYLSRRLEVGGWGLGVGVGNRGSEIMTARVMAKGLIRRAISRGWRKRCPHCGQGPIFSGWSHHLERCDRCGLVYERNPGDTWAFTVIGDRIPIALMVALIYLGVARFHLIAGLILFALLGVVVIATAPNRWGVGIALHYLSRVYFPEPTDPVPADSDRERTGR